MESVVLSQLTLNLALSAYCTDSFNGSLNEYPQNASKALSREPNQDRDNAGHQGYYLNADGRNPINVPPPLHMYNGIMAIGSGKPSRQRDLNCWPGRSSRNPSGSAWRVRRFQIKDAG
jgi:hypothetical protein